MVAGHNKVPGEVKSGNDKKNGHNGLDDVIEVGIRFIDDVFGVRKDGVGDFGVDGFD